MFDVSIRLENKPGEMARTADTGTNVEVVYSDHANQLILVVDDFTKGKVVSDAKKAENGL